MHKCRKILILYITERSGHHSAAKALARAFSLHHPDVEVLCVNAFRYVFPFAERIVHWIYMLVIKRLPKIWEAMYDNPRVSRDCGFIKNWIHDRGMRKMAELIDSFHPDVILCTQAFPCGLVADYKKANASSLPLIGVLTDFAPHQFWIYDQVDSYVVPCAVSKKLLVEKGVSPDKVRVLGIPIDPKFTVALNREEILANFGLRKDAPVVLIMGGSHGLGPVRKVIRNLDEMALPLQIIVVCGLNKRLYRWINRQTFSKRILSFKFTDQVERLMSIAAVIVTKPGGITSAEALAKRVPMVILHPIPGQEARNTQILTEAEIALKVDDIDLVASSVEKVVGSAGVFHQITQTLAWQEFSKPHASRDIARLAVEWIQRSKAEIPVLQRS